MILGGLMEENRGLLKIINSEEYNEWLLCGCDSGEG